MHWQITQILLMLAPSVVTPQNQYFPANDERMSVHCLESGCIGKYTPPLGSVRIHSTMGLQQKSRKNCKQTAVRAFHSHKFQDNSVLEYFQASQESSGCPKEKDVTKKCGNTDPGAFGWDSSYLIFVTFLTYGICGEKFVMWRNFRFLCTTDVEKSEISPYVE